MDEVNRKLRLLKEEDFIWLIYFFIVTFAIISNYLERKYVLNKDRTARKYSFKINTTILIVAFFIYLYFAIIAWDNIKYLKQNGKYSELRIAIESFISSVIFLIGGVYALYVDYDSKSTSTDIAIF